MRIAVAVVFAILLTVSPANVPIYVEKAPDWYVGFHNIAIPFGVPIVLTLIGIWWRKLRWQFVFLALLYFLPCVFLGNGCTITNQQRSSAFGTVASSIGAATGS
jgi:hypothetical protein